MNRYAKTSLTDALMGLAIILALCVPSISGASPGKANGKFSQRALEVIESRGNDKDQGASIRRNLGLINGHAISVAPVLLSASADAELPWLAFEDISATNL